MPDTMVFDFKNDFDTVSVTDALGTAGIFGSRDYKTGEFEGAAASLSGVLGDAKAVKDVFLASNGYALNPQFEILYRGPKNRQFRYTFKFAPRSAKESKDVEDIITTLRFHAAPDYAFSKTSRYFIPPSEFRIQHMRLDPKQGIVPNYTLPRIGQCVLEEVNVNYASAGHFATFEDGRPVEIQMDLTFTEVNILTKADIGVGF